jgi:hypothetical protein
MTSAPFDPVELRRIANAYPPEAADVPAWEREHYFTPLQQAAWALRFERESAEALP